MKHYVYKITDPNTGQFYYGSRSHEDPENDEYMGSMKSWTPEDADRLVKEIIRDDFYTREDAINFEDGIIGKYIDDELNENYHRPHKGFHTSGMKRKSGKDHHNYGNVIPDDVKAKISKNNARYWKGKSRPEHSKQISGVNHPNYGKRLPEDSIQKMKDQAVDRYTLNWFVERYGEDIGTEKYNERCDFLSNRNKELYKDKTKCPMYGKFGKSNPNSQEIFQCDMDGNVIKKWSGMAEAARELGIYASNISSCCSGYLKSYKGYIWKKVNK